MDEKPEHENIIKSRDDPQPVFFTETEDGKFKVCPGTSCSWATPEEEFGPEKLRSRIEPWLTALLQSEHLSLLVGSGLTNALHCMATSKTLPGMTPTATFTHYQSVLDEQAANSAAAAGRRDGNIEDKIRVANELLRGLEILSVVETDKESAARTEELRGEITCVLNSFARSILDGERGLITANAEKLQDSMNYLVSFLMSFASRTGTRDRLHIFTTNYDRCIELGSELAGLHLLDRFVGSLAPIFRSSRLDLDLHYNPPGIRGEPRYLEGVARFTKLHGSVDWVEAARNIRRAGIPFGAETIDPYLKAPGLDGADALRLMIYPNSAKDRETAHYPYVELFRDFAAAACRPNSTLICFGYGFGDEHINRVIEDMLTLPSAHLVVISHSDRLGRIMKTYESLGRRAQITILLGKHLGDFKSLVDNYLPKPAIDRTTFRMAELLKARWGANKSESSPESKSEKVEEGVDW